MLQAFPNLHIFHSLSLSLFLFLSLSLPPPPPPPSLSERKLPPFVSPPPPYISLSVLFTPRLCIDVSVSPERGDLQKNPKRVYSVLATSARVMHMGVQRARRTRSAGQDENTVTARGVSQAAKDRKCRRPGPGGLGLIPRMPLTGKNVICH